MSTELEHEYISIRDRIQRLKVCIDELLKALKVPTSKRKILKNWIISDLDENLDESQDKSNPLFKYEENNGDEMIINKGRKFGEMLTESFRKESYKAPFTEVQQFRALIKCFGKIGGGFYVEEFHGPKHQVYFNGSGTWGRIPARCELCDVLILTYSLAGKFRARVTFLQAKLSKEKHPDICNNFPHISDNIDFKANLEQWDLLARRPDVLPVPPFQIHPKILSNAILPSIGSFGVFHRSKSGHVDFFYSSADQLSVVGTPTTKHARLKTIKSNRQRIVNSFNETTYCCCLPIFGEALYNLEIGSPFESLTALQTKVNDQMPLKKWIRSVLTYYLSEKNNSSIARELLERIPAEEGDFDKLSMPESIPSLIIIRSDVSVDESQIE